MEASPSRAVVFAVSLVVAFVLIFQASRLAVAETKIESAQFDAMKQAVSIEPGNADYWDRIGRFQQLDFAHPDLPEAVNDLQQAVALNPHNANYWVDLSAAYEDEGDNRQARSALESARAAYPASSDVLWEYGNFLIRQNDYPDGFRQIHRAIQIDPKLIRPAISRIWRATQDVGPLLNKVLPKDEGAYFSALDFLVSIHNAAPGMAIWSRILALNKPFALDRTFPFVDELIREEKISQASEVWQDALSRTGTASRVSADGSVVSNGGFDRDFTNGGFGWRVESIPNMTVDFDTSIYHSGSRSLRLDFGGGANIDLWQPYQIVPATPNQLYKFQAFVRTEAISTESGIRFLIADPMHSDAPSVITDGITQTHDWTGVTTQVKAGPDTHVLRISVRRLPSRLFENQLSGTVWIDDISLVPASSEGRARTQ